MFKAKKRDENEKVKNNQFPASEKQQSNRQTNKQTIWNLFKNIHENKI